MYPYLCIHQLYYRLLMMVAKEDGSGTYELSKCVVPPFTIDGGSPFDAEIYIQPETTICSSSMATTTRQSTAAISTDPLFLNLYELSSKFVNVCF